eukprot:TRINITY_DN7242_c0_g2_i2.p1 TRINITY_DN7242_c0_g2~~TRINITY_DN7242_c0_g2_i2.p1  ORF type:complete len:711 (-),score=136.84 TRINITY_DN7242_c0_g2_i2:66-1892(-)
MDLNFAYKFVQKIEGLENYAANLRSLDLSSNNIREMENLGGMAKLRELKLHSCQISRIQGLHQCPSLVSLHLEDNFISVIEGLEKLCSLEALFLERNRIHKIGQGLRRVKLRELRLGYNQLESFDGLDGMVSLEVLDAGHNQIETISADHLKGLRKLDDLQLAGNQLSSLGFLSNSDLRKSLALLDLSDNRISTSSLSHLPSLPLLSELNLARNQLDALSQSLIDSCPCLEILDVSENHIESVAEVEKLKNMQSLRELSIVGNPIDSSTDDLSAALSSLSQIEYIDNKPVLPPAALEDGPAGVEETFRLTNAIGNGDALAGRPGSRPSTGLSRPTTSSGSRPGTAGQRPGTAQSLKEAGVQQPLMHAKPKENTRKSASAEQVEQWERQTLSALDAIRKQVEKTSQRAETELQNMNRYFQKAVASNRRYEEFKLREKQLKQPSEKVADDHIIVIDNKARPSSRASAKLRLAVESGRDDQADVQDCMPKRQLNIEAAPVSPPAPKAPISPVVAACDEVEELDEAAHEMDEDRASPQPPPAAEVEEEIMHTARSQCGRAAARPPSSDKGRPASADKELHTGVRAGIRRTNSVRRKPPSPATINRAGYPPSR